MLYQGFSPKQAFEPLLVLWPFLSFIFISNVYPDSLRYNAFFVCKDYSSMMMVSELPVVLRHFTLTRARSVPFAVVWLLVHTSYMYTKTREKRYGRFLQYYRYIDNL